MQETEQADAPGVHEDRPAANGERRPLALVLHDDPRMLGHVHALIAVEGLDAVTARHTFGLLERRDRDVVLVVVGATALSERDVDDLALLRERHPLATLLVLYPTTLRERAARALGLGADATLPEPFYPGELSAHTRRAMERHADAVRRAGAIADAAPPPEPEPRPVAVQGPGDERTAVEQLAKGVSHCISQPLTILELMLGGAESGDPLEPAAVREQLERLKRVAGDLTRLSSRARIEPVPVELNALVTQTFPRGGRRTGPRFDLSLAGDELTLRAEPEMLRRALELLRDRASRVTPRGEAVRVVTQRVGEAIELAVTDCGPTPAADALDRFFQPAPDDDAVSAGTWLEMAVFAGIVRSHGGATSVRAAGDNGHDGLTVTVRLPGSRVAVAER